MEQNKQNTALLVMDMQPVILRNFPGATAFISNVAKAIANARDRKIPVIYVVLGFRTDAPEISMNNKGFAAAKERFANAGMEEMIKIESAVAPLAGEIVVIKHRVSAFSGSDLEIVLRAQNIQHIVLTGVATSGVVLSTTREAADKNYRITVLSDGCADSDAEVHHVLTTKIFSRQADILSVEEWNKR
jgi:nicotinamidase-related amidase